MVTFVLNPVRFIKCSPSTYTVTKKSIAVPIWQIFITTGSRPIFGFVWQHFLGKRKFLWDVDKIVINSSQNSVSPCNLYAKIYSIELLPLFYLVLVLLVHRIWRQVIVWQPYVRSPRVFRLRGAIRLGIDWPRYSIRYVLASDAW